MSSCNDQPLIQAPESTNNSIITPLAYIEAYDALSKETYAFLAYREEKPSQNKWLLKIKANRAASSTIDPDDPFLKKLIADAAQQKSKYALIGINLTPQPNDCRRVENRLYFDELLNPTEVEIALIMRQSDDTPTPEKINRFPWPGDTGQFFSEKKQLLFPPHTTTRVKYTQLGYINSYDVISNKDYAFLAYEEESLDTGRIVVRVKSTVTDTLTMDMENPSFKYKILTAAELGQMDFIYGFNHVPKVADPRLLEFRIFLGEDKMPDRILMRIVTRHADNSPRPEINMAFNWPKG
jgi:hypothetical protein